MNGLNFKISEGLRFKAIVVKTGFIPYKTPHKSRPGNERISIKVHTLLNLSVCEICHKPAYLPTTSLCVLRR